MIKKLVAGWIAALCLVSGAFASEGGVVWDKFPTDKLSDQAALQNGAKLFVNYCLNCHSAQYLRYNRLRDIGLTEDQIKKNLLFTDNKVGETMVPTAEGGWMPRYARIRKKTTNTPYSRLCQPGR